MRGATSVIFALMLLLSLPAFTAAQTQPSQEGADRQILVLLKQVPQHYRGGSAYGGGYGDLSTRAARERLGRRIAADHRLEFSGNWPMPLLELDCFIMAVPDGVSVEDAVDRVSRDVNVEWSQPVSVYRTLDDDQAYDDPLLAVAPATQQWRLQELHDRVTGRGISVAIIDTRVDDDHPDLIGQIVSNIDFVPNAAGPAETHGTAVAGIIAAKAGNGLGAAGVAPQARLMALRACRQLPQMRGSVCDSLSLARALHHAIEHNAQVINLSLGGPPDRLLSKLLDLGMARGVIVVAATDARLPLGGFPASHRGVIAVSGVPFSNIPQGVVAAPGQDIPTTLPGGRWTLVSGSSYAAAHVTGLMALLREEQNGPDAQTWPVVVPNSGGVVDARSTLLQPRRSCGRTCARTQAPTSNH